MANIWQRILSTENPKARCMTPLVPHSLWLSYYVINLAIIDGTYQCITINLIVRTEDKDGIYINGDVSDIQCHPFQEISDTGTNDDPMSNCQETFNAEEAGEYTLYLASSRTFGAYAFVDFDGGSIACFPLGSDISPYVGGANDPTTQAPSNTNSDIVTTKASSNTDADIVTTKAPSNTDDDTVTTQAPSHAVGDTTKTPCLLGNATHEGVMCKKPTTPMGCLTQATLKQRGLAMCKIPKAVLMVETTEEVKELAKELASEIKSNLTVNARNTSASIRKLTSAQDSRQSSTSMGILAITLLSIVLAMVVLPDLGSLIRHWNCHHRSDKHSNHGSKIAH